MPLEVLHLGLCNYETAYEKQKELLRLKKQDKDLNDFLILTEHPEVYTYGRKSKETPDWSNAIEIERGGEATYHNPGQLVAYPILSLHDQSKDLHLYLRNLELSIIECLKEFGIATETRPGATGVWIQDKDKKIASIGVAVSSWITYHGIAINVDNALEGFERIQPCGFSASVMTSLKQEGVLTSVAELSASYEKNFRKVFQGFMHDPSLTVQHATFLA